MYMQQCSLNHCCQVKKQRTSKSASGEEWLNKLQLFILVNSIVVQKYDAMLIRAMSAMAKISSHI